MEAASNSEMTTFRRCRRKWYLGYYRKLVPLREEVGGPLRTGTIVHDAFMVLYKQGTDAAMERLTEMWAEDVAKLGGDVESEEGYEVPKTMIEAHDMARCIVEGYIEWLAETGADQDYRVIDAEIQLRAPSPVPGVDLIGKIDLLVERLSTGQLLALDHKTCKNLATPIKLLHLNTQFKQYHLLQKLVHPEQATEGTLWNGLRKVKRTKTSKPPYFARMDVYHTTADLTAFWNGLYGIIGEMVRAEQRLDAGEDHQVVAYPSPDETCSWQCEFFGVCGAGMFDDGRSDAEGYLEQWFTVGDPLARYDSAPDEP